MNPSDLRTAPEVVDVAHDAIIRSVAKGPMVNSAQVYSTGLYNNSSIPAEGREVRRELHTARRGADHPARFRADRRRNSHERDPAGPLPASAVRERPAGGTSCAFSNAAAGRSRSSAIRTRKTSPGQPDVFLSNRGFGTQASVDPVILGAQKVRLNDPVMSFLGTNDSAGDYRRAAARRATSFTPTIARRPTPVRTRSSATWAAPSPTIRRFQRTNRGIRSSTSSRGRSRRASASRATCTTATAS